MEHQIPSTTTVTAFTTSDVQARRRRTHQIVQAAMPRASVTKIPVSIHWKVQ
jgi:hypothetical protein